MANNENGRDQIRKCLGSIHLLQKEFRDLWTNWGKIPQNEVEKILFRLWTDFSDITRHLYDVHDKLYGVVPLAGDMEGVGTYIEREDRTEEGLAAQETMEDPEKVRPATKPEPTQEPAKDPEKVRPATKPEQKEARAGTSMSRPLPPDVLRSMFKRKWDAEDERPLSISMFETMTDALDATFHSPEEIRTFLRFVCDLPEEPASLAVVSNRWQKVLFHYMTSQAGQSPQYRRAEVAAVLGVPLEGRK